MKKLIFIAFISIILQGCVGCEKKNLPIREGRTVITETTIIDTHNSRNSLDYWGTYHGNIPCEDCNGIQMKLTLNKDYSYELRYVYLGKPSKTEVEAHGTFTWNDEGSIITLSGLTNIPNQFLVGENMLIMLDMDGNRFTGDRADRYILKK